jgi:hypothetical protein
MSELLFIERSDDEQARPRTADVVAEQPPAWFRTALAAEPSQGEVLCDGAVIRFRCWGPPDGHDRLPLTSLGAPRCPVTLIRAEHGIIPPRLEAAMIRAGGVQLRVVPLPEAHHHMMIDVPMEMLAAIRTCLNHHGVFPQELQ